MDEETAKNWLVYKHEHNGWDNERPKLVAVCKSVELAKQKQKELLDYWTNEVKSACATKENKKNDVDVDYSNGVAKLVGNEYKSAGCFFKVEIVEASI